MRTYQQITGIGVMIGILIAYGLLLTSPSIDIYPLIISIFMIIGSLLIVFTHIKNTKIIGIYLMIVAIVALLARGSFGVLPFAIFLSAGIITLRFRSQKEIVEQKMQKKRKPIK